MARDGFVTARPPGGGEKRRVPLHYLEEPFNWKIPASTTRGKATPATSTTTVTEPARPEKETSP
jgi:hypothetical protein